MWRTAFSAESRHGWKFLWMSAGRRVLLIRRDRCYARGLIFPHHKTLWLLAYLVYKSNNHCFSACQEFWWSDTLVMSSNLKTVSQNVLLLLPDFQSSVYIFSIFQHNYLNYLSITVHWRGSTLRYWLAETDVGYIYFKFRLRSHNIRFELCQHCLIDYTLHTIETDNR